MIARQYIEMCVRRVWWKEEKEKKRPSVEVERMNDNVYGYVLKKRNGRHKLTEY